MRLSESPASKLAVTSRRTLSGLFAEFDIPNENERIYPKDIYEGALEEIMSKITEGRLLGELDHPLEYDEIRLNNVSHVIKDCFVKGNQVFGTVEILDTPSGKIVQSLMEAGVPIGISSRGIGNTRSVGENDEVTDLKLITFDLVAEPSFSNAILTESAKIKLNKRLDTIERNLPLNESKGTKGSARDKINTIRERINESNLKYTTELIESVGNLTFQMSKKDAEIKDSKERNNSLNDNMLKLQESYTEVLESNVKMKESNKKLKKRLVSSNERSKKIISETKKRNDAQLKSLTESYEDKILALKKELAIEKRGLSYDKVMPILEGLTTEKDINDKLDLFSSMHTRRYSVPDSETLTENVKTSTRYNGLARIVSSV